MHFYLWSLKFTSNFPYTTSTGRVGNLTGAFPAAVTASAMHSAAMLWDFLHAKMPVTHLLQEVQGTYVGESACTHFLKRGPFSFFHAGNLPCGTLNECTSRVGTILVTHCPMQLCHCLPNNPHCLLSSWGLGGSTVLENTRLGWLVGQGLQRSLTGVNGTQIGSSRPQNNKCH